MQHLTSNWDRNWDLDQFKPADLNAEVEAIHLCALRNDLNEGDEAGEPPTNHWVICLQIRGASSVMLDMAPGYGTDGLRGKIELTSLDESYTNETLHAFTYEPTRSMTVVNLVELINEKGRDAFNFSPEWEGCRFWLSVVMRDLEDADWVERESANTAYEALAKYWRNPEGQEPRIMRDGTFRDTG